VVLVPHRDAVIDLRGEKRGFFSDGFYGAYSFPVVAPLCVVRRPLTNVELKETAKKICDEVLMRGGLIEGAGEAAVSFFGDYFFWGEELSISALYLNDTVLSGFEKRFEKIILCEALLSKSEPPPKKINSKKISFRASALANMVIRPLDKKFSFEWKIGRPVWL
jgi:hypothetical protein